MVLRGIRKGQLETDSLVRFIALACILLALVMAGMEATHAHSENALSQHSSACAICLSPHAQAPVITVHFLPVLQTVESLALAYEPIGKSTASERHLFIRPPPAA